MGDVQPWYSALPGSRLGDGLGGGDGGCGGGGGGGGGGGAASGGRPKSVLNQPAMSIISLCDSQRGHTSSCDTAKSEASAGQSPLLIISLAEPPPPPPVDSALLMTPPEAVLMMCRAAPGSLEVHV